MSAQGDDFSDRLIREAIGEPSQEQIEYVLAMLANTAVEIRREAAWPSRFLLLRPGEYMVDGRTWEEFVCGLMVPVKGPVDLWRHAVRKANPSPE